jgi:hypothetical protein
LALRIAIRKGAKQEGIEQSEDSGVDAEHDGDRSDGHHGEAWGLR